MKHTLLSLFMIVTLVVGVYILFNIWRVKPNLGLNQAASVLTSVAATKLNNYIYISQDNGQTWQKINFGSAKFKLNIFVRDVVFDPNDAKIVYVLTNAGILVSRSGGASWQEIVAPNQKLSSEIIKILPDKVSSDIIYFVSSDAYGSSLSKLNLSASSVLPLYKLSNDKIKFLSQDKDTATLYLGTSTGLVWSSQDGIFWKKIGEFQGGIKQISSFSGIIYVLSDINLYKTTDNGGAWQLLTKNLADPINFVKSFTLDSSGNIYLLAADNIFLSENKGLSWRKISFLNHLDYSAKMSINFLNPSIMYIASGNQLYQSNDFGYSWRNLNLVTNKPINAVRVNMNNIYLGLGDFAN